METKATSSGILHQKYVTLPLSTTQKWTWEMTFTGSFQFKSPFINTTQSNVSLIERILCFLLLFHHLITIRHLSFKGEVGVSCADVQHL